MARLTSVRWVFEEEHIYKMDDRISRSCVRLGVSIEISVLDDALKMSINQERLKFRSQKYLGSKYGRRAFRGVASTKVTPNSNTLGSDNRFWIIAVRTASVRCGLTLGEHFTRLADQIISA
jgi:hypothetical protein